MELLQPTVNQMVFLFAFIILGFILAKWKFLPSNASAVLSKLENMVFIPALVLGTFIESFTVSNFASYGKLLLVSLCIEIVVIPLCILICKACAKDTHTRNIYTYGLCFSNFGFMGNAVVKAIFPQYLDEYILFTIPLWFFIYVWAVPTLLIGKEEGKSSGIKDHLKSFLNPMFICMFIGMIIGITKGFVPETVMTSLQKTGITSTLMNVINTAGDCMSPVAMLLTGIVLGSIDLKATLKRGSIYVVSALRLLVFPLVAIAAIAIIPFNFSDESIRTLIICIVCSLAMPLGLNTIVVPSAYGKDTSTAAGMALISHLASVITIPIIFVLLQTIIS